MKHYDLTGDRALIKSLGGPAKLAILLGYEKNAGGVQRVHNWLSRGIPAAVKLQRADVFLADRYGRPASNDPVIPESER